MDDIMNSGATAPAGVVLGARLGWPRMLGFTMGDFGFNLYWQSITLYLLFYYTDAVGLSAAAAGLIYMVASIWDGIVDPFIGAIADRTRTRWGSYRPYLLFGCVPLAASFALLYWRPPLSGWLLIAAVLGSHLLFRSAYAAVSVPFSALSARLTRSGDERSSIAGLRMLFATVATIVVSLATQPLAGLSGKASAPGFFLAAVVFALIATAVFPLVFLVTREPAEQRSEPRLSIAGYWSAVVSNRAFWAVIVGISCTIICSTALAKSVLYYYKYALHDEKGAGAAFALGGAAGLVIIPAWIIATKWIGKRTAWFASCGFGVAGLAFFALVDVRSSTVMTAYLVFMQISVLGMAMTYWSMLPDTVEYGEWRTGRRAEAFVFGLGGLFGKVALGLGAGLFGLALEGVGYRPNVQQSAATLHGLKMIMIFLPLAGFVLSAFAMLFYPLKRGIHEGIVEQLAARRANLPETLSPELIP